jgi:hypothetical protein
MRLRAPLRGTVLSRSFGEYISPLTGCMVAKDDDRAAAVCFLKRRGLGHGCRPGLHLGRLLAAGGAAAGVARPGRSDAGSAALGALFPGLGPAPGGATITEFHTFEPGKAVSHDDLALVDVVVAALSWAICTNTNIWVPFPMEDFGREQHLRRLSLVLQRHGLNLLFGRCLTTCPITGGMNEMDFALRRDVAWLSSGAPAMSDRRDAVDL